jgi:antitoxin component YwqK of YwqJK toxin-antitoxin module
MNYWAKNLEEIKTIYGHYNENPIYCYKICQDLQLLERQGQDRYIVIMKKIPGTLTNENRTNVIDARYAKFRADRLEVCVIFDVNNPSEKIEHVINIFEDKIIKYEINNIVTPDAYDDDLDEICSGGIHYFNDMFRTFYYRDIPLAPGTIETGPFHYTGHWIEWYDDGQKESEGNYQDGKKTGEWFEWFEWYGRMQAGNYQDNKKIGKWIEWNYDGQMRSERNYLNDIMTGKWIEWYENGQIKFEGNYLNGMMTGKLIEWYDNGQIKSENNYLNGIMTGK